MTPDSEFFDNGIHTFNSLSELREYVLNVVAPPSAASPEARYVALLCHWWVRLGVRLGAIRLTWAGPR